jgi:hypothetical protein
LDDKPTTAIVSHSSRIRLITSGSLIPIISNLKNYPPSGQERQEGLKALTIRFPLRLSLGHLLGDLGVLAVDPESAINHGVPAS